MGTFPGVQKVGNDCSFCYDFSDQTASIWSRPTYTILYYCDCVLLVPVMMQLSLVNAVFWMLSTMPATTS